VPWIRVKRNWGSCLDKFYETKHIAKVSSQVRTIVMKKADEVTQERKRPERAVKRSPGPKRDLDLKTNTNSRHILCFTFQRQYL